MPIVKKEADFGFRHRAKLIDVGLLTRFGREVFFHAWSMNAVVDVALGEDWLQYLDAPAKVPLV